MNQLPLEDNTFDDEIANAPNPFWTFINGQSVRVQSKFNRPIITQKRRPKTRTKRFYTEDELKKYTYDDLYRISKFNSIYTYNKKRSKKIFIELLIKKPIEIPHLTKLEENEKQKNIMSSTLEAKKRYNEVKEKIEKLINNKKIQTEEKFIKIHESDKTIYEISNFGRTRLFDKKTNKYSKPKTKVNRNYQIYKKKTLIKNYNTPQLIANNFIRKMKDNEKIYFIDNNEKNFNVNNLLILTMSDIAIIKKVGVKNIKNKKGYIQKTKNGYNFRYIVNRNDFSKLFETKEEAERAQAEYQEKIDDIENPFNSLSVLNLSFHSEKELKKVEIK